jgi:hypothetical protein
MEKKAPVHISLRSHPLMQHHRAPNWPPTWFQLNSTWSKRLIGEVGVLKDVMIPNAPSGHRLFLVIEHESKQYMGSLIFDDPTFCWMLGKMLKRHLDWPIKTIGDLDLSQSL